MTYSGVLITGAWNVKLERCTFEDIFGDVLGYAYGVTIVQSSKVTVALSHCTHVTTCITVGGYDGLNHEISYLGNTVYSSDTDALNMHPPIYGAIISDNIVYGTNGITFSGASAFISNNRVIVPSQVPGNLAPAGLVSGINIAMFVTTTLIPLREHRISKNVIHGANYGVRTLLYGTTDADLATLSITDNTITDSLTTGIYVQCQTQCVRVLSVRSNTINGDDATYGVYVYLNSALTDIDSVTVNENSLAGSLIAIHYQADNAGGDGFASISTQGNSITNSTTGIRFSYVTTASSLAGNIYTNVASEVVYNSGTPVQQWRVAGAIVPETSSDAVDLGNGVTSTTATRGFFGLSTVSGTPTAVITNPTGYVRCRYNTATHMLCCYDDGAWRCGPSLGTNIGTNTVCWGHEACLLNTNAYVNAIGYQAARESTNTYINAMGYQAASQCSATLVNAFGYQAAQQCTASNIVALGYQAGQTTSATHSNFIGTNSGTSCTGSGFVNAMGTQSAQSNTGQHCNCFGYQACKTNTFDYCTAIGYASSCTAANQVVFGSSPTGIQNIFNPGGYSCVGCSAVPTNTASGTISSSAIGSLFLQAFGPVTLNAVFGFISFNSGITNAPQTCATATVTNNKVATSSTVNVELQGWTGTDYTNGVPRVGRRDTAGSSSGSFIIQVCNDHDTNSLSGTFYIRFTVLG
jgi:hypothetical protein